MLEPGAILTGCRIQPNGRMGPAPGVEPYVMEFQSCGRQYRCPLCSFQPRTQPVEVVSVEGIPARKEMAV
jgi:hypothetical protein